MNEEIKEFVRNLTSIKNPEKIKSIIKMLASQQIKYDVEIRKVGEPSGFDLWDDKTHIRQMIEEAIDDLNRILNNLKEE